ncbi:MAG: hypothetical protein ACXAD7_22240, partial [Candidatus Kariarchaeaceae archaeon]
IYEIFQEEALPKSLLYFIAIIILVTITISVYFKEFYNDLVYLISSINILQIALISDDTITDITLIKDLGENLAGNLDVFGFSGLFYLFYVILMVRKWSEHPTANKQMYLPINLIGLSLAMFVPALWLDPVLPIPLEIIAIGVLLLAPMILQSDNDINAQSILFGQSALILLVILLQNKFSEIDHLIFANGFPLDEEYLFLPSFIFLIYTIEILVVIIKSNNQTTWNLSIGLFYSLILLAAVIEISKDVYLVHPVLLLLAILGTTIPQLIIPGSKFREIIPITQAMGLIFLLNPNFHIVYHGTEIALVAIGYVIWVIISLGVWYSRGTTNQLFTTLTSIFSLNAIFNIIMLSFDPELVDIEIMVVILISSVIFSLLYYPRLSKAPINYLVSTLISAQVALLFTSLLILELPLNETEELLFRLAIDWFVFLPILGETVIFLRYYIKSKISREYDSTVAFNILTIIASFVVLAIMMDKDHILELEHPIYSIKILAVAICFWMISFAYNDKTLAWTSSIFTVLASVWLLNQVVPETVDSKFIIIIFIVSFIGILMVTAALINEVKYTGEPITASLAITGSLLTFVTIFTPALLSDLSLLYFLPNAVWAVQGLILYSFSQRYNKEYLRRIGFGILMIDIIKTIYDMFTSTLVQENPIIQYASAVALGSILIYIFYAFTSDKEEEG